MRELGVILLPELVLIGVACALFLVGVSKRASARRLAAAAALATLAGLFCRQVWVIMDMGNPDPLSDPWDTVNSSAFAHYVKLIATGVGALTVLLAWPTNPDATGSRSIHFGGDAGEFFALMLLSIAGVCMVSVANDLVLLFLAIELASIPTYVMVSVSRPVPAAQEAGVKYFFLGAMAAAVMLFGFSYLYGTTGAVKLNQVGDVLRSVTTAAASAAPATAPAGAGEEAIGAALAGMVPPAMTDWRMLGVLMLLAGFAFKIAAVPLHTYAGDVYQGAATPVTAFLAFVPKTSGMVAILKLLFAVGGTNWLVPAELVRLLWVVAALTMTVGNVLGLMQVNVKRVLAYSSVAHSGYMLVGVTALAGAHLTTPTMRAFQVQADALEGVLFYLAAYGIMNAAAFGVLQMLPSRAADLEARRRGRAIEAVTPPATTAETFEDLAGQGRRHPLLGLAMAVACFSLIGLPLTVGFFGKFYLIRPALEAGYVWLVVVTVANAAISAAYYQRIVATMYLRPDPATAEAMESDITDAAAEGTAVESYPRRVFPIGLAVGASAALTVLFGTFFPATDQLARQVQEAAMSPLQQPYRRPPEGQTAAAAGATSDGEFAPAAPAAARLSRAR